MPNSFADANGPRIASESEGDSELSDQEEDTDALNVKVDVDKTWTTPEDADTLCIERLAQYLRPEPLLPPQLPQAPPGWPGAMTGVKMPLCHCAFIGCNWTSNSKPCERLVCNDDDTGVHNGEWKSIAERSKFDADIYGCCGDVECIKHHILAAHRTPLVESCSLENIAEDSFDYYCEAIAWRGATENAMRGYFNRSPCLQSRC